ncbi:hypothetical protein F2P81_021405 [Scophthalmus maximus]|uniref:COMM domain-containing protein 6 n=1 Tax=Scophthalmus maximus TaxID=52904 RepID=A0A6A4S3D3_SCOMX|nr:hypothetical protein F2P81_021405 [Scophthalmus maximus]
MLVSDCDKKKKKNRRKKKKRGENVVRLSTVHTSGFDSRGSQRGESIFKSAGKSNISGDELVSRLEDGSSKWPKASLQVLHRLWTEHGASVHAQQDVQAILSIGQLVDMQWKLSMAVSSDTCRSLNSPYVCLLLKVVEPSGHICQRSFEMTIPQFQNFHKQFKEMAAVMETV